MATDLSRIRNLGIIAHIDAGKTSTTEGLLFFSGLTHRYGNIDDGTTVMDFLPDERARGITIMAATATIPWQDCEFHLIDTPGHIDFTAEVERSLRAIDGAAVIFSAVEGVEAQSEKVWRQADNYQVPKIAFINKMDRIGASYERVCNEIDEKFGRCALPMQFPDGAESEFKGMVDLLTMEYLHFHGDRNEELSREPVPESMREACGNARIRMVEKIADHSDEIAELYLEGAEISREKLAAEIRRLTIARKVVPVFLGSAKREIGIQPLGDAVCAYLPSPSDVKEYPGTDRRTGKETSVTADPKEPFAGFIFKINASNTADLFFVRIYSGTLHSNDQLINGRTGDKVRVKQLYKIYAKSTEQIAEAGPGDIVGMAGLKDCAIGDTLCAPQRVLSFGGIVFPEPVISMVVEPKFSKDKDKLDNAIDLLCREDQTLRRSTAEETGQRVLSGMGELHLEVTLKRVSTEFGCEIRTGEPRVAYRETLVKPCTVHSVFDRTIGDNRFFADLTVEFAPLSRDGEPFLIEDDAKGLIPNALRTAATSALADGLRTGGLQGYPLIYVSAKVKDLKFEQEITTPGAVAGAVNEAIAEALQKSGSAILEPVMKLEILAPEDTVGEISMYLQPRRAIISDMVQIGNMRKIICQVPLAEMFGFGKALPRLSGGRGSFSLEPCGYQEKA